ncbi:MAG: DUF6702 family protein [Bacteroidota bacterium]
MAFIPSLLSLVFVFNFQNSQVEVNYDDHAIYVSVIEIVKSEENYGGTVKVKVFMDDLQDAIYHRTENRRSYRGGCQANDEELQDYFENYLKLSINSSPVEIKLFDCERLEDAIWLNFEFENEDDWAELQISANYLMELFPTQTNVVSIRNAADQQFTRLNKSNSSARFTFSH